MYFFLFEQIYLNLRMKSLVTQKELGWIGKVEMGWTEKALPALVSDKVLGLKCWCWQWPFYLALSNSCSWSAVFFPKIL